jgi:penicillin-binding protein 2
VVVDPSNGRVLTMVNQKLALAGGFQPCSTIKLVAAVAGLSEGVITPETSVRLSRRKSFDLTDALAHSNNYYFATIGDRLGFEKIQHYARLMGLGERAGWNIAGEEPGTLPAEEPKEGMGMMTSFGSGIYLTPLQLASLVSVFANGGTLYYLQYPKSQQEIDSFQPKVKRQLDVARYLPQIKPGMNDAVEFGTARRANYDPLQPIYGKTGTCSDTRTPTHLGWFGSFNEVGDRKLVVAVLLTGGRPIQRPGGLRHRRPGVQDSRRTELLRPSADGIERSAAAGDYDLLPVGPAPFTRAAPIGYKLAETLLGSLWGGDRLSIGPPPR